MALRDQPYIPLYIQDFLTDEKLIECSPLANGVYIRLMCIMHKSEDYGKILLRQKDKQTPEQVLNFAAKVAKQMPYDYNDVESGLKELLEENVICIEGDFLVQKRMVKDNSISLARAKAGKKSQFVQANQSTKVKTKQSTNTEYEIVNENEYEIDNENYIVVGEEKIIDPMPILEFYQIQLNGTQHENGNIAWRPMVSKWFKEHLQEAFTDDMHVKNSFKKYYLFNKPKKNNSTKPLHDLK